jgi:hypothetical protein
MENTNSNYKGDPPTRKKCVRIEAIHSTGAKCSNKALTLQVKFKLPNKKGFYGS